MDFFKAVVLIVLALGAPPVQDADGTTPLHKAVLANDIPTIQKLLRSGANASAANRYGVTPLSLAATNGSPVVVEMLLKAGADPKANLPGGQTVLMTAARTGNPEVVKMFLDRGADPNARENTNSETALMWAAAENHPEAAKLLIAHGADVNAVTTDLKYAKDRFGLEGVLTILPHGHWTPLLYAARQGSLDAAKVLVDANADKNARDPDLSTPAIIATINGHYDVAGMLVERGADPNLSDTSGMAVLYAAVDMN